MGLLETALRDTANDVWSETELTNIIDWRIAALYPRNVRQLDARSATYNLPLVQYDYHYTIPTSMVLLNRVDLWYDAVTSSSAVDGNDEWLGPLDGSLWEVVGDIEAGTATCHVSPQIVDEYAPMAASGAAWNIRLVGYGRYDGTTNLITDRLVPLILAEARAEAYRRVAADRSKFEEWLTRNQQSNVSVNELFTFIQEAQHEADRLRGDAFVWKMPVQGRI